MPCDDSVCKRQRERETLLRSIERGFGVGKLGVVFMFLSNYLDGIITRQEFAMGPACKYQESGDVMASILF